MTARLQAWIRQAENDLAMAEFARSGQFYAQACYHCSQAAEKALKGLLIGLGQDPPRSHSLERLVDALADLGLEVESLRALQLKALSRMTTATRYPDADEAPMNLFDARDCDLALGVAKSVLETVTKSLQDADSGH
jgi:HEPN domain-containing protein